jgi:hypothetical protein
MQHKGIIVFPFFHFLRIMISDFQVFFSLLFYNFLFNRNVGFMFCSLNFTCILGGAMGSLNLTWMLQFKMLQVLLFGVDFNYIFNFCTLTTSSYANVRLGFVFHIHF